MSFMDPVQAARQQEDLDRLPFIIPVEFYHKYVPQDDGSIRQDEWVRWKKKGATHGHEVPEKISRLMKNPDNLIWQVIKPYYEKWKDGQTSPVDGTPLEAWPGAEKSLVAVLNSVNIRSIEDFARLEDSAMMKLNIPGLREKQGRARAFIEAQKTTAGVAGEISKLRDENEKKDRALAEMQEQIAALTAAMEAPEPKRRGRPPKVKDEMNVASDFGAGSR